MSGEDIALLCLRTSAIRIQLFAESVWSYVSVMRTAQQEVAAVSQLALKGLSGVMNADHPEGVCPRRS